MGVLSRLASGFGIRVPGKKVWNAAQIRDLLDRQLFDEAKLAVDSFDASVPHGEAVSLCLRGEVAFRQHDDALAERMFLEALSQAAGLADAHYGLSLVLLSRGESESAQRHAQFAINAGNEGRFSAQMGLCQLELGNSARAAETLARAVRLDPQDKASWNNLGIARRAQGKMSQARTAFARALELDPSFERAATNAKLLEAEFSRSTHGVEVVTNQACEPGQEVCDPLLHEVRALAKSGSLERAIDRCEQLSIEHSDAVVLVVELASLYRDHGDPQSGLDALQAFISRNPDNMDATSALGCALVASGEFVQAKPLVELALDARPDDVPVLLAMADIRFQQERYSAACALLERAFALDSSIHMKGRLASCLIACCRYDEGLALVDEMLAEDPAVEPGLLGMQILAFTFLGRYREVLPKIDAFLERQPFDAQRRFARASINLMLGNYAEGWHDYRYRNLDSSRHLRMLHFPLWEGQPLNGKSLLVLAEQGLGDQVMFASCLPDVLSLNPDRVVVEAIDRVAPTIARSFPSCHVIATKQDKKLDWVRDVGAVDFFIPMGDLPLHFRRKREDFPVHRGYFRADSERISHWGAALGDIDGGRKLRIGLSWRGGTEATRTSVRSFEVTKLGSLLGAADATWVCLQYGDVKADLLASEEAGMSLHYWPEAIKNLDDFAALISSLDMVITVCNTTVHYAGAVGKPVWVLAPRVPEWRYGLDIEVMPWYPSSRIFRQDTSGDWGKVLTAVAEALQKFRAPSSVDRQK